MVSELLAFWPFSIEIFAFGASTDELQVHARIGHTVSDTCAQHIQELIVLVSEPLLTLLPGFRIELDLRKFSNSPFSETEHGIGVGPMPGGSQCTGVSPTLS